jgi:hypothetical protein
VAIYKYPVSPSSKNLVATAIAKSGTWIGSSESIEPNTKYIAYGVRLDGEIGGALLVQPTLNCDKECVLIGTIIGTINTQQEGIVVLFNKDDEAIASGVIKGGNWSIKEHVADDEEYYLKAIILG